MLTVKIYSQISPGDLTKAHAHLEGLSNCTKCHVLGEKVNNAKCLDCHTDIKELMNKAKGYHSSSEVKGKDCWSCHSEHHGRNFRIINFNPDNFNHIKTDFELTGAHLKVECKECHQSKHIKNAEIKKLGKSYLGLKKECISCHEDYHQNTLGNECSSCHNTEKFKPALKFNHDKAAFKLIGAHLKTDCIKCHPTEKRNGREFQKFRNVSFSNCGSCHKDVHLGRFGNDCQSCHSTSSFKDINKSVFNHDKTNYPLIGKHKSVSCNECHNNNLSSKPKYSKCTDCHSDYHKGEFTANNIVKDCSECHNENGFSPSYFTIEMHSKSKFVLTGAHLAMPCKSCHYTEQNWSFKLKESTCISCHKNVHGNEIMAEFMPGDNCSSCHITQNWNAINFNHDKTDFHLLGKHKDVSCNKCHYTVVSGNKSFKFASSKSDCEACHKDVHFGQFIKGENSDCQRCHTFDNWKPEKFDHEKTQFPLKGAHQKLKCSYCHKPIQTNGNVFIKFKMEDIRCAACHS